MTDNRKLRTGKLNTVGAVATELGRLYRLAKTKQLDTLDAYRLAQILAALRQCLEVSDIEKRIAELENEADGNVVPFEQRKTA